MVACGAALVLIGGGSPAGTFFIGCGAGLIGWAIWGLPRQWRQQQRERNHD